MSALTALANWLDPQRTSVIDIARAAQAERTERASPPFASAPNSGMNFGPGIGNQPTSEALLREARGFFDMGQRAISNRLASLDLEVVVERRDVDGTTIDEVLDDHVLAGLLDNPHPNFTTYTLLRLSGYWVTGAGQAFWLKVGSPLGVPVELHPIPVTHCERIWAGGVISHYVVTDGMGRRQNVAESDVIDFYFPDPENPWNAEGYLAPIGNIADASKFADEHLREHYRNDATPKAAIEVGEANSVLLDPETRRAWENEWQNKYNSRTGSARGVPGLVAGKLIQLAMQTGADMVPILEYWRDASLMGTGTPRSILGQVVSGDRSSVETSQYVFDRYTILPVARLFEDALTTQLAMDFDPSLRVRFKEFVSADKEFELKREDQDLRTKVRSINQIREDRGHDPVPWGEQPVGSLVDTPYDGTGMSDDFPDDDEDALGDRAQSVTDWRIIDGSVDGLSSSRTVTSRADLARAEWQRQIQREKRYVPGFTKRMRDILKQQRASVLERLKAFEPRARITADELFTEEEWRELFEENIEPYRVTAFEAIVAEALDQLGGVTDFAFTETQAAVLRRQGAELVTNVNRTTRNMIARALEEATIEGESIDQMASRIDSVFKTRRKQARTIARTEILKASQEAQVTAFEVSEVVERKRWNTSLDGAVRDSHAPVNGQGRDLREPFELGDGELADAPGIGAHGGTLSAGNSINCRCFVTPILK